MATVREELLQKRDSFRANLDHNRQGRLGVAFIILGSYLMLDGTRIFIPRAVSKSEKERQELDSVLAFASQPQNIKNNFKYASYKQKTSKLAMIIKF